MKYARQILAILLCTILTVSPWTGVLSEEALEAVEPVVELEPEVALEPEPDAAPEEILEPEVAIGPEADEPEAAPEADEPAAAPEAVGDLEAAPPVLAQEDFAQADSLNGAEAAQSPDAGEADADAPELFSAELIVPEEAASVELGVNEKWDIPASFSDGGSYPILYKSKNPKIASVSTSGTITARKVGSTEVTLTSDCGAATVSVTVRKAPSKVTLSAPRKTLGVGEKVQLTVKLPSGTQSRKRTFMSGAKDVATVDEYGNVTAVSGGKAKITVTTFNKKKADVTITVKAAPEEIAFTQESLTLGVGQEAAVDVTMVPELIPGAYKFSVEAGGEEILAVDESTGAVKALAEGEAKIIATPYNAVGSEYSNPIPAAELAVTVVPAPEEGEVSFGEASVAIGVGESCAVPELAFAEGRMASYAIKSKNKKIAAYDSKTGKVKGVKKGTTQLVATTHNGVTASFQVTVKAAPSKVTLSAPHKTLGVGEEIQLTVKLPSGTQSRKRTFNSGAEDIATVDEHGNVTAVDEGKAKITVTTFNKKKADVTFTVMRAPESISLPEALTMGEGESYAIPTSTLPEGSGGGRTYAIDDETIATIDPASGKIEALAVGSTTVHVKTYNGKTAQCALTVKGKPAGISLSDKGFTLSAGDKRQLNPPTVTAEDAGYAVIKYKSSDTSVAKVSAGGLVTAVKAGTAKITASTYNKTSKSIKVTVKAAVSSISFEKTSYKLFLDHEYAPKVKFSNGVSSSYSLTSGDPEIAEIEADGHTIYAKAPGTVEITATSYNKKKTKKPLVLTIPALPDDVWFAPESLTLGEGDSAEMQVQMEDGEGSELWFDIGDSSVASIERIDNETVKVVAQSKGETALNVQTQRVDVSQTAQIRVLKAPSEISLYPSSAVRRLGENENQLQLTWKYGGSDEGGSVTFSTSDKKIATVSSSGLVTIHKTGSVTIAIKTYNGHQASCELTVGKKPTSMNFTAAEYPVAVGDSVQLPVRFNKDCCESYALESSDEGAVAIDPNDPAKVMGLASGGSATVTATSASGLTASCTVRVIDAPAGISLPDETYNLVIGYNSTQQLAPVLDGEAGTVHYRSDNPQVAIVDYATGLVTAIDNGECTITATTYNGYAATCKIVVTHLLDGVRIGIDPGHQARGDLGKEPISPKGGGSKNRCAYSSAGVAHVSEHTINLQVGLKLRKALEKLGATVVMTRTEADVNISNKERAELMNRKKVHLALRLHCNSWSNSSARGVSYCYRKTCAWSDSDIKSFYKNDPELQEFYGSKMTGQKLMSREQWLADCIRTYFKKQTNCDDHRGVGRSDTYTMNNWSKVPCILVEMGFMTNSTEGWQLVDASYQTKMVRGMVQGICKYMGRKVAREW